jgi:pilus assembly protein CpaF
VRQQISSAIEIVVQIARMSDGTRKITAISEITGMEGEVITMQDLFVFDKTGVRPDGMVCGRFRATGIRPKCAERLASSGMRLPPEMFEYVKVVA